MSTVLISGGTGLIGRHLCKKLIGKGYSVSILSRTGFTEGEIPVFHFDTDKNEIDERAIREADYIVHLAGANIGEKRWTKNRKQLIVDSRVKTAQLIFEKVKEYNVKLKAFISASAIGYYGAITTNKKFSETDSPYTDFLGETCRLWEKSADSFEEIGIRTVKVRTGVVLTSQGGALAKMITPVKLGIGSAIGSGKQFIPWIHIDDLCNIYIKAIEDTQMHGAYNAVAPDFKTNREFTKEIAKVLKKPFWFPDVPDFIINLLFVEMSEMILKGSSVSPDKIINAGYEFIFPGLEGALKNVLKIEE